MLCRILHCCLLFTLFLSSSKGSSRINSIQPERSLEIETAVGVTPILVRLLRCIFRCGTNDAIGEDQDTQQCVICLETVRFEDCEPCCVNGHLLHLTCFAEMIKVSYRAHLKCPICRIPLIRDSDDFHVKIATTLPSDEKQWKVISGHQKALMAAGQLTLHDQRWYHFYFSIIDQGNHMELQRFLQLKLIDINRKDSRTDHCALIRLFEKICRFNLYRSGNVERLMQKVEILLAQPEILLDRLDEKTDRHIIYWAIDANHFNAFLRIIDASAQLDLSNVFGYICSIPNREVFYHYLLTLSPKIDLFGKNLSGITPLQYAIDANNQQYVEALQSHPDYLEDY